MPEHVMCIASFTPKPGQEDLLEQVLNALVEPTRSEKGCIKYTLCKSIEAPTVLTMVEEFESMDAFDFHNDQPYVHELKARLGELTDKVTVLMSNVIK